MFKLKPLMYRSIIVLAVMIVALTVFRQEQIASYCFDVSFVLVLLLYFTSFRNTTDNKICMCVIMITLICVIVNSLIQEASLSFDYFKKMIFFFMTILFFQISDTIQPDSSLMRTIQISVTALSGLMILYYFADTDSLYMLYGYRTKYLLFHFTNPNLAGLFLCVFAMMQLGFSASAARPAAKLIHLVTAGFLTVFTFFTKSRSSEIVLVAFYVFCCFHWITKRKLRISPFTAGLVAVFPMIFAILYMLVVNSTVITSAFSFLVEAGKGIDARVAIWKQAFTAWAQSPLIGAYSQISNGSGMSQMHNTHVDILASYGIVSFILTCVYLYRKVRSGETSGGEQYMHIAFLFALILGIGEASLFSGGLCLYIIIGSLLFLRRMEGTGAKEKKTEITNG